VAVTEELLHRLVATTVPVTAAAEEPAARDWLEITEVGTTIAEDEATLMLDTAALVLVLWTALEAEPVLWLK
jgi:hypothetical protein